MAISQRPVVSTTVLQAPMIDPSTGKMSWEWMKFFDAVQRVINAGFDQQGSIQGTIGIDTKIAGRGAALVVILGNIDDSGIVTAAGIDFARSYLNKDTDHIGDGIGSPLAGGRAAYQALVTSPPAPIAHEWVNGFTSGVFTQTRPDYTDLTGLPVLPLDAPATAHKWVNSFTAATGAFTETQPDFSDVTGNLTTAQLPVAGINATITTAALTGGGTQGSMVFTNGVLTASTPAT